MKILKVEQPGQSTGTGPVLRLQTGQRLAAIALTDAKPGDRAMLSVAGGQLQVTTQHPLKAGQAIDLEVTRLGQQVHLRPLGPPPDPKQLDQAQLTRNLLQAQARLSPSSGTAQNTTLTPTTPPPGTPGTPSQATPTSPQVRGQPPQTPAAAPQASGQPSQATTASSQGPGHSPQAAAVPPQGAGQSAQAPAVHRSLQAFLANQPASETGAGDAVRRSAAGAGATTTSPGGSQSVPPGLNGLLPLLSALREPRLIRGLVSGWLATQNNPPSQPNPLAGLGGPIPAGASGLTETPLGAVLQQAARQLRARPDLAPRDPAVRQATLDFMQRLGEQVERSQVATALSQGAAGQAAGTQSGPNQPIWLLEIPLQLANEAHSLRMAIREQDDGSEGGANEGRWQIDLAMDWPQLGPLHAALVMRGERIDVDLFADRAETLPILEASRSTLARGLADAGLTPGRLGAYAGPPPASVQARLEPDTAGDNQPSAQGFLSEQA